MPLKLGLEVKDFLDVGTHQHSVLAGGLRGVGRPHVSLRSELQHSNHDVGVFAVARDREPLLAIAELGRDRGCRLLKVIGFREDLSTERRRCLGGPGPIHPEVRH